MDSLISVTRSVCSVRIMASSAKFSSLGAAYRLPAPACKRAGPRAAISSPLQDISPIRDTDGSDKIGL